MSETRKGSYAWKRKLLKNEMLDMIEENSFNTDEEDESSVLMSPSNHTLNIGMMNSSTTRITKKRALAKNFSGDEKD
jgi:hypothetical protein